MRGRSVNGGETRGQEGRKEKFVVGRKNSLLICLVNKKIVVTLHCRKAKEDWLRGG